MSFNIEEWGASDEEVTRVEDCNDTIAYWFNIEDLSGDCITMNRDDALGLAKYFDIKQEEIDEL